MPGASDIWLLSVVGHGRRRGVMFVGYRPTKRICSHLATTQWARSRRQSPPPPVWASGMEGSWPCEKGADNPRGSTRGLSYLRLYRCRAAMRMSALMTAMTTAAAAAASYCVITTRL